MTKLVLALSFALAVAPPTVAQENVAEIVMAQERKWEQAHRAGDAKAIDAVLAPDFVSITEVGALQSRADYIAQMLKTKVQESSTTDMKVQVHGNAAVVTGIAFGKGVDSAGKPFEFRARFADTFVKMPDGRWQCITGVGVPVK